MKSRKPAAVAALGALAVTTLVGVTAPAAGASTKMVAQDSSNSISVLYTNNYVFDTDALAAKWWSSIAKQWKAADPSVKLTLLGTGGTDVDEMNKAAVLFRSPSETPCVIQLPTTYVGEFAGSGYLASLNSLVSGHNAPAFWTGMPKAVQQISTIKGTVYAVNAGNNDSGILYNKVILKKAGVAVPWVPKTWQDIITAAREGPQVRPEGLCTVGGGRCRRRPDQCAPGDRQPHRWFNQPGNDRPQDRQMGCRQSGPQGHVAVLPAGVRRTAWARRRPSCSLRTRSVSHHCSCSKANWP